MEIGTVVIALVLVFIAWKVFTGLIKVGVILLVVAAAAYFLLGGF
jgi:hypothetical protein